MTTALTSPTLEQMHLFLKARYKHERFEGRNSQWPNSVPEGGSYSNLLARSALESLTQYGGKGWISAHESATGEAVQYDAAMVAA